MHLVPFIQDFVSNMNCLKELLNKQFPVLKLDEIDQMKKSIFIYFHNKFDFIGENLQVASSLNEDEMKLFKGIQGIEKLVKQ